MIERIEELRVAGAEREIAAARLTARRWRSCGCATSGARPSCRSCCAAWPQLEPAQRAAVGKAANQARQALEALIEDARGAS